METSYKSFEVSSPLDQEHNNDHIVIMVSESKPKAQKKPKHEKSHHSVFDQCICLNKEMVWSEIIPLYPSSQSFSVLALLSFIMNQKQLSWPLVNLQVLKSNQIKNDRSPWKREHLSISYTWGRYSPFTRGQRGTMFVTFFWMIPS